MRFNSLEFVLFFPTVVILYFALPQRFRWMLLLLASCYFYMAFIPIYILILFGLIFVDYFSAILIEKLPPQGRKICLLASILSMVSVLFIFKYFNFFNANITALAQALHWNYSLQSLQLILPIGLSFHTFQSLSYVIEVYRGNFKAERHLGIYALYVMFFPQLVAGPIERPYHLLVQFHRENHFDYDRVVRGLRRMALGFFKKIVIADRLAVLVNHIYNDPYNHSGIPLILATISFAFQIYCDFSGYSDIAIGAAKVMGYDLMENFRWPYTSTSIRDFWQRWHISLMSWFRDYIYIPLGGNRVPKLSWYRNIAAVFLISGLWHGASWTFVIWGGLHALYMIFANVTRKAREKFVRMVGLLRFPGFYNALKILITFCMVSFAWIFFRANSLADALYIVRHLFDFSQTKQLGQGMMVTMGTERLLGLSKVEILLAILFIGILEVMQWIQRKENVADLVIPRNFVGRWAMYYGIVLTLLFFGVYGQSEFIYFQF